MLLGYDIGSSAIKAVLLDPDTGRVVASATSPEREMVISAPKPGWAEQHPDEWWTHVVRATQQIREQISAAVLEVSAIGISYQMHGLVIVDQDHQVLRPAIIWCDSRAVEIGDRAFKELGPETCLTHCLNSPGNFTASKLRWVQEHEPKIYARIHKAMLPGDYIALKMTGEIQTSESGLSEGVLWDFLEGGPADQILDHFTIDPQLIPEARPSFSLQGELTPSASAELGIRPGARVAYRAGDQPNNAFALNVLNPGELAATAGTSGVVYAIDDRPVYDPQSRVNTFVHVNHQKTNPRFGVLLCVNGTGILNSWLRKTLSSIGSGALSYEEMNTVASEAPVGSAGLFMLPYGNGAERTLLNRDINASLHGLSFNVHDRSHLLRSAQEGIVFSLNYGLEIMGEMGLELNTVRAGHANMFLSPLFAEAFACVSGATVELLNSDGAQGAARGAGLGAGLYGTAADAFSGLTTVKTVEPTPGLAAAYEDAYQTWLQILQQQVG